MIINLPTADGLNEIALRLYFSAWKTLVRMRADFDYTFEQRTGSDVGETSVWASEWAEYLGACQPELQSVCSIVQQSNELALKARLSEVSPFLLLMHNDPKLTNVPKDVDFTEFRTLDAVELPAAVNTFTSKPVSDVYIRSYGEIRALRNKITHLGESGKHLDPDDLRRRLVAYYIELWPGRRWLADYLEFTCQTRIAFLYDGRYESARMEFMHELPYSLSFFSKSEFAALFGIAKSTRRYLCHACIEDANTKYADIDKDRCKTAFLNKAGDALQCLMCGLNYKVLREPCIVNGCKGDVIGANGDGFDGLCHTCGEYETT